MKVKTKGDLIREIEHISHEITENNMCIYSINEKIKQSNLNPYIRRYHLKRKNINELKMQYDVLAKEYNAKYGETYKLYNLLSARPLKSRTKFYNKLTKKPLAIR